MPPTVKQPVLKRVMYGDFSGGVNSFIGATQIKDNESPNAINCDFKGRGGVGNRQGFTQIGAVADSMTEVWGLTEYHTASIDQLVKAVSNQSVITLYKSTDDGAWSAAAGDTFTDNLNLDFCAGAIMATVSTPGTPVSTDGLLFSFNGTDVMKKYDGTTVATHTGGTKGYFGEFYNYRLWCVDEQYPDTLNFSTQGAGSGTGAENKPLDFTAASTTSAPGTITLRPGSGSKITALKSHRNTLYVFCYPTGIYKIEPATSINTFTVTLITNAVGCVSHRSIAQAGEDLYFAADDGVYSLGDVANFLNIRTTNKSAKMQKVFDALSGANKKKLVGKFFNFKYHLFYSLYGTSNDSCICYDIRYGAWQDWRGMAANNATTYTKSTGEQGLYFGEPTTGKVMKMYSGSTDDGSKINSSWDSKLFDNDLPDIMKLYFDATFVFGALNGSVTLSAIYGDSSTTASKNLTQSLPQGGFGNSVFGRISFGAGVNTSTITRVIREPMRMKTKAQKFSIQYRVVSSDDWQLDSITSAFFVFDRFKFPSVNKIN